MLMLAALDSGVEMMELLLKHGADVDAEARGGVTALL
jgi:ankyrin repeat protein